MAVMTALAATGAIIGAGASIATAVKASDEAEEFKQKKQDQEDIIKDLEAARQNIYNPMAGLTNEADKLGVATQAAKFQAQEADIALANTLDNMRASGHAAGGATALAQAALRSKAGISADIQMQELSNQKASAQAQMQINAQKAEGAMWAWQQQETRDMQQLDRAQNLADKFEAQEMYNEAQMWNAIGNVGSSLTSGMGNIAQGVELDNMP